MPNTFFTADTHMGHGRIIQYCNRPFPSAEAMNEAILERFNSILHQGDVLYHLGDVSWSNFDIQTRLLKRLITKEVHLILGNHDNKDPGEYLKMGFRSVQTYKKIRMDIVKGSPQQEGSSLPVVLFHYPIRSWDGKGKGGYQLYGHCHGNLEPGIDRSMDVGVDTHDFYPWAWEEIRAQLGKRAIFSESTKKEHTERVEL